MNRLWSYVLSVCCFAGLSVAWAQPAVMASLVPLYIQGRNGTNTTRIPCAYWIGIDGLTANATYRYYNQVVRSSDSPTTDGSGNSIFANPEGFVRTSSPGFATPGNYGEFIADNSGCYHGWMVTEPTGNARFIPGGYVYFRIMLNDGADGTTVAARLTVSDSVRVLKLNTESGDSAGTGLRAHTLASARDFVVLFDNSEGNGRPLSATFIENDGSDNSTSNNYVAFYSDNVNALDGNFGTIIPNSNGFGVRRIERRIADGSIVACNSCDDGNWPSGAFTVNPVGGATPIILTENDVPLNSLTVSDHSLRSVPASYTLLDLYPNPFNSTASIRFNLPSGLQVNLAVLDATGRLVTTLIPGEMRASGYHEQVWNAASVASGTYFVRLQTGSSVLTGKLQLIK